jgi:2,4-dienoyl-CoA reductase-like NADH-dependent reductase (Old Yellow Enzyme family)
MADHLFSPIELGGLDFRLTVEEGVDVARALKHAGVSYFCCSSGGVSPLQKVPTGLGYQVHLAEAVSKGTGIPVRAVGTITEARQADAIITGGRADLVALARAILADPRWPMRAAATLGQKVTTAPQLARAAGLIKEWAA